MKVPDPFELAVRQNALDREVAGHRTELALRKHKKLTSSPLGFFRGSARLFYEILAENRSLTLDAGPSGHVVGDMHLENVGAYRTDSDDVVFDLNDFDDATTAPVWVDKLRLAVSVLLAGRSFQATAVESLALASDLLAAYDEAVGGAPPPTLPKPIVDLCDRARKRSRKELLDMRAPLEAGGRRFSRGERYLDLDRAEIAALPSIIDSYRRALGPRLPAHAASWRVVDAAHRIAGNGSLGRARIALLVADESGTERLFEFKEAAPAAPEAFFGPSGVAPASRVVKAASSLVKSPPRQLVALDDTPLGALIGRKLCPEEDKLDLARLSVGPKLFNVARVVGNVLGHAHRRDIGPFATPNDHDDLLDRAVYLAGIFESAYLAYSRSTFVAAVAHA
ncbi:MAG: DUF2252 family protein [Polyangiaceae bacterium]|nr:DUF2252 family protein [Polyangiaceae bacterium]